MLRKRVLNRRSRRARASRARKASRRRREAAAMLIAGGSTLVMAGHGMAQEFIDPFPTADDGRFYITGDEGALVDWSQELSGSGYGTEFLFHLTLQQFYFRADTPGYDTAEQPLSNLTLQDAGNINPATGSFEGDSIFYTYGGADGEPIQVDLEYEVADTSSGDAVSANITKRLRISNTSGSDLDLSWFLYTDLDLEGNFNGDVGQLFSGTNTIRQTSSIGSIVDTRVSSGDNPSSFEIAPFADLLVDLEDSAPTDLVNPTSSFGPGDVTHAFQWNFSLAPDGFEDLEIITEGTFTDVQAPTNIDEDGSFVFDVFDPPVIGDRPAWYDPEVAIGYDYVLDSDDNAFAEVYLPLFGDGEYTLVILDPDHPLFGQEIAVSAIDGGDPDADPSYDLTYLADDGQGGQVLLGADAFRILGIEPDAGIDPDNPTGFPTGLTFLNGSFTTFEQTAIVPEPSAVALAGVAAVGLMLRRTRPLRRA